MQLSTLANHALGKLKSYFEPKQTVQIKNSAPLFQSRTFQKSTAEKPLADSHKLQAAVSEAKPAVETPQLPQNAPVRRPLTVNWGKLIVAETVENPPQNARIHVFILVLTVWLKRLKGRDFNVLSVISTFFKDKMAVFQDRKSVV